MKALWLASWYPNKISPYTGDFLKRHAEAASIFAKVEVIFVIKDHEGRFTKDLLVEHQERDNLKETTIYYHVGFTKYRWLNKWLSHKKFVKIYKRYISASVEVERPNLLHVQIGMKAGMMARWAKKVYGIPYLVSDQWTGLLKESLEPFSELPYFLKLEWRRVIKNAHSCSAVSLYLADAMKQLFGVGDCRVIPNVVNKEVFGLINEESIRYRRFIHVSTFSDFKNPKLILSAFKKIIENYPEVQLKMVGPETRWVREFIETNKMGQNVDVLTEVSQEELAGYMQSSDVLLLYSKYETFGCVVIEANACGIPVLASDIPVLHETIIEAENGFFADPDNVDSLIRKIEYLLNSRPAFDRKGVSATTIEKYNYSKIGNMFFEWYKDVVR